MKIAVITGASSGMGRQYALQMDQKGLDEIWVIARRENRLQELQQKLHTPVRVIPLDLTKQESIAQYENLLKEQNPAVSYLVNASGFGKFGSFERVSLQDCCDMIDLNVKALVILTRVTLPYMKRGSHIIQMCSSSAFLPLPYLNIYASTKAFILHYSKALRTELKPKGISITAVCPYFVATEFIGVAEERNPGLKHYKPLYKAEAVVRKAIADADRCKAMSVLGTYTKFFQYAAKFMPQCLLTAAWLNMLADETKKL